MTVQDDEGQPDSFHTYSTDGHQDSPTTITMAILKGLKAEVIVNGVPVQEYVDDEEENPPKTIIKYIEATSGAQFGVRFSFTDDFRPRHDVVVSVYVDGKYGDANVIEAYKLPSRYDREIFGSREKVNGRYYQRDFCFAQLTIGEAHTMTSYFGSSNVYS